MRIPDLDGSVTAAGDQSRPIRTERDAPYSLGVSAKRLDQVTRSSVPQLDFGRFTRSCELRSVGAEGDTIDRSIVRSHFSDPFPGLRVP